MADSTPPPNSDAPAIIRPDAAPPTLAPAMGIQILVRPGALVGQPLARQTQVTGMDPVTALGCILASALDLYNAIQEQAQRAGAGAPPVPVPASLLRVS